ncbi:hypothetical protein [Vibrio kanaloae]|nr:hypothetical protein [Vibrio kanaloae]
MSHWLKMTESEQDKVYRKSNEITAIPELLEFLDISMLQKHDGDPYSTQ